MIYYITGGAEEMKISLCQWGYTGLTIEKGNNKKQKQGINLKN